MNNRFKFRVWDKKLNKFTLGYDDDVGYFEEIFSDPPGIFFAGLRYLNEDSNRYIIQQYTGLTDSNGKEIYEGDILLEYIANETQTKLGICKEILGGWKIFAYPDSSICWHGWKQEVIGNIFETPELLKLMEQYE